MNGYTGIISIIQTAVLEHYINALKSGNDYNAVILSKTKSPSGVATYSAFTTEIKLISSRAASNNSFCNMVGHTIH
jgi:hypothetical protein